MRNCIVMMMLMTALSCLAEPDSVPIDGYAAVINDRVITISDVLGYMRPIDRQLRETYQGRELQAKLEEAFEQSRKALIEESLILVDFEIKGASLPPQVIDERVNAIVHDRFDNDRATFLAALAEQRMTMDELREQVTDSLILMMARRQEVMDRVSISPLAVQEAYEARMSQYQIPGKINISVIAVNRGETDEDREVKWAEIQKIQERLNNGEDFNELAVEVSEDAKAGDGGSWGWIEPDNLRRELQAALVDMNRGEISEIVEAGDMYYIIRVDEIQEASIIPLDEVRDRIVSELRVKEEERLYNEWINRLRAKYYIKIFQ